MKLHKASILYKSLNSTNLFIAFFLTFPFITDGSPAQALLGVTVFAGIIAFSGIYSYIYWLRYNYEVTEDSFDIRKGVFRKRNREIPLHRIQNVDITSEFTQRLLGIAQVNLETAGGGETEARLRFVSQEEAKRIQKRIRALKRDKDSQNIADKDEEAEEEDRELIFELESKELTLLSLFTIDTRTIAGVFFFFTLFAGSIWAFLHRLGASSTAITILLIAFGVLATWIVSSFRIFSKYYGYKLYKNDDVYEYEKGLIQRYSGSIPSEKIQVVVLDENPLKRLFNYTTVRLETAGYSPGTAADRGSEALVPLATRERSINLAQSIKSFDDFEMNSIPSRARYRYFVRYLLVLSLIFIIAVELTYLTRLTYIFAPLVVLIASLGAHLKWSNKGYVGGEDNYFTMNGFWSRKTVVMPYYRIQNIISTQTILQKKWGLSTIFLDSAGNSIFGSTCKAVDIDQNAAFEEVESVRDEFFESLDERK